jgi:glucose-1-phosphate adenylyltransferase
MHIESGAELTIAAKPISRRQATGLGIIGANEDGYITKFFEKPADDADIRDFMVLRS